MVERELQKRQNVLAFCVLEQAVIEPGARLRIGFVDKTCRRCRELNDLFQFVLTGKSKVIAAPGVLKRAEGAVLDQIVVEVATQRRHDPNPPGRAQRRQQASEAGTLGRVDVGGKNL